jgi:hypothetical protein
MNIETAIDMRPPLKTRKSKKNAPAVTQENRYAKFLEDDGASDLNKPE